MRPIAVLAAALAVAACSSTTSRPAASSSAPTVTSAPPAAVDCGNPANSVQRLVCSDPLLTDLDHRLQAAYQQALARAGADAAALGSAQAGWAAARDGCAGNADVPTCVREAYQTRLVQLAIADPTTVTPPVVNYRCPADLGPLTAQFYNELDPTTAVLDWKGAQQILFLLPSGSGARYGRQGSEYWEHQGEVTLDLNGTKFVCSTS
ncbi:MliC family protein [Mycobacterium sherrisii]|uniref:Uncharacterized protein n=1 Tax=Mycobacterium sherrisii TaxID=243061 RepID=A0A1E3T298_9MYCO|nr:MliC family protein [Mycobacterium sherrisii]MCV7030367.1 MliC family protein [Mycobacterium sherrisii]MEC4763862.1 MliC family protein [Mycobacterium sherrisii]ODR08477.1 hypothetical protein BHQ21_06680 [Mycobacterium sherrisii]ORW75364.1 hypothetical protein AWC25_14330 [Mycobacterium sherrisii]